MTENQPELRAVEVPLHTSPAAILAQEASEHVDTGSYLDLFRDLHAHPELSMQEHRTASRLAERLHDSGLKVAEGVGGTGVVGVLENGDGPVVMLRGDMDALPIREETNLNYRSEASGSLAGADVPVMHACGHDMHTTALAASVQALASCRDAWSGTVIAVGQPGEETFQGANAMLADGLFSRFPKPDVALGQHVMPIPTGWVLHRPGTIMAATTSMEITFTGQGGHGSQPSSCVDPITLASFFVTRVQTVVSQETHPFDAAVVTVATFHAGRKANIIPDTATITLNLRAMSDLALSEYSPHWSPPSVCSGAGELVVR